MIIGAVGLIGSGKDTIADYLVAEHGFKRESLAGPLKDAIAAIFGWDRKLLEGCTAEARSWREQVDLWWASKLNIPALTPRWVLQYWGTEVCRIGFHDDIWISALENRLRHYRGDVVISDCRFTNELNLIKRLTGKTLRVKRGEEPSWYNDAVEVNKWKAAYETDLITMPQKVKVFYDRLARTKVHSSETAWAGYAFDYCIENDGTIEDLHKKVDTFINFNCRGSGDLASTLVPLWQLQSDSLNIPFLS